jgi:hypothetical protein
MSSSTPGGGNWKIAAPDVTADFLDGEVIAIHLPSGFYFSLRETAAFVWQALAAGWDAPRIAARLAACPGASSSAAAELEAFLGELAASQLIVPGSSADPAAEVPEPSAYTRPVLEKYADLQELLLLDPIHEVTDEGWPHAKP